MVTSLSNPYWQKPQNIDVDQWLLQLPALYQDSLLVQHAAQLAFVAGKETMGLGNISCWQHGISIAESLIPLNVDDELFTAALLYPVWDYAELTLADIEETLGKNSAQLLAGAAKMEAVSVLQHAHHKSPMQIENCRKMLLAMAKDLRVVLLKLAERLHTLRTARFLTPTEQKKIGQEVFSIYAPLANRLGLGEFKWQIEDLAFRATHPEEYRTISKQLDMKRIERETFINSTLALLKKYLDAAPIKQFELMGRAKHIYSMHKKMTKKNIKLNQLYDISAVRILVNTIEECYQALDIVQQHFDMIPAEFDDYISAPKENGYRSIHTAVYGPNGHVVEIQIRTFAMHQESELGVAAHWRYKEGSQSNQNYEAKIAWLREILSWQNEIEANEKPEENVLADRVYVLTPEGEIIDLPQGATPLDFAYTVHTNIGHRCRGAKINGRIVALTTPLKMGDQVEILTNKIINPSRDWLNIHLGYLATARARAKVAHWFRQQDFEQHVNDGKAIVDRELKRLNLYDVEHEALATKFDFDNKESFYAALGANTLRTAQLASRLEIWYKNTAKSVETPASNFTPSDSVSGLSGILIEGTGHWLTHIARCCQPLPGDAIAGYISQKHSIAIHKISCRSFLMRQDQKPDRVLSASWGNKKQALPITLIIEAEHRPNLNHDIIHLLAQEKLVLLGLKNLSADNNLLEVYTRVNDLEQLNHLLGRIQQIPQVKKVYRK